MQDARLTHHIAPRYRGLVIAAAVALAGLSLAPASARSDSAQGTWLSADGGTKVRIADCGGKLCGTVVWLKNPIDPSTGRPKTDKHNPDPSKRDRPLIGLQVVYGLTPDGPNKWSGRIYNADDGNTYQAYLQVQAPQMAKVEGCVLGILCKGETWTRTN